MRRLALVSATLGLLLVGSAVSSWVLTSSGPASASTAKLLDGRLLRKGSVSESKLSRSVRAKLNAEPQSGTGQPGGAGKQGATGLSGDAGSDGAIGPQGPVGPVGPTGPAGATGATGAQGPAGPSGASYSVSIPTMDAVTHCNPSDSNSQNGLKFTTPTAPNPLYLCDGSPGLPGPAPTQLQVDSAIHNYCTFIESANNCKGATGDTGPQGPQGDKGDKGDTGATGPQGPAGRDGVNGQISKTEGGANVAGNNEQSIDTSCGSGQAIAGGYRLNPSTSGANVVESYAITGAWRVTVKTGASAVQVITYATCLAP